MSDAEQGNVGAGQQDPTDSTSDFNVADFHILQRIAELDTVKIVKVMAVHPGSGSPPAPGTVDVTPLVNQVDGNGNATPHGVVNGLAVLRIQTGPWVVINDPAVNDVGILVCSDRDASAVVRSLAAAPPGSSRKYNVADGFYLGLGLNASVAASLWLKADGTWVLTDKPGNVLQGDANGITATPKSGGVFKVVGNFQATGTVIAGFGGADQVGLQTHIHTQVNDSHGDVEAPTAAPTAGT